MAKKAAKKTPAKKAAAPKAAAAKKAAPKKKSAPKPKPAPQPAITDEAIGTAAGAVWGALAGNGWQSLAALKKAVDAPTDVTLMAVGWLAREGKLDYAASGKSVKVALR